MGALGTKYADNEVICRQGEVEDRMYVIQSGRVEVLMDLLGARTVIGELGAGDIVGVMALFGGEPHYATLRARGEARVLAIGKRELLVKLRTDGAFTLRLLERLGKRVRALVAEVESLRYGDMEPEGTTQVRATPEQTEVDMKTRDLKHGQI